MSRRPPLSRWVSPAARLAGGIALALGFATARPSYWALATASLFLGMAIVLARPPARRWQLRLLVALLGSSALLIPFALGGDLARLGPLFLRSSTAILAAVGMSLTLSSAELSSALEGLRAPRALAQLVAQTTAQLGAISSEGQRLVLARKLRGSTGTSANLELLSTLLIRSSERAERRALATELRGAAARIPRAFGDGRSVTFVFICCLLGAGAHWVGR